jgi:hypothetical protein
MKKTKLVFASLVSIVRTRFIGGAWTVLAGILALFLCTMAGGVVFHFLEENSEREEAAEFCALATEFEKGLPASMSKQFEELKAYLPMGSCEGASPWHIGKDHHAFFFAFEILSTIGYGDIGPGTVGGQIFAAVFALAVIPFAGVVFTKVGGTILSAAELVTLVLEPAHLQVFCRYDVDGSRVLSVEEFKRALLELGIDEKHFVGEGSAIAMAMIQSKFTLGLVEFVEVISALGPDSMRKRRRRVRLFAVLTVTVAWIVLGTLSFSAIEDWSHWEACYFCIITLTTVGLGDFYPLTAFGEDFHFFYCVFGLGIVAVLITAASDTMELSLFRSTMSFQEELMSKTIDAEKLDKGVAVMSPEMGEQCAQVVGADSKMIL